MTRPSGVFAFIKLLITPHGQAVIAFLTATLGGIAFAFAAYFNRSLIELALSLIVILLGSPISLLGLEGLWKMRLTPPAPPDSVEPS